MILFGDGQFGLLGALIFFILMTFLLMVIVRVFFYRTLRLILANPSMLAAFLANPRAHTVYTVGLALIKIGLTLIIGTLYFFILYLPALITVYGLVWINEGNSPLGFIIAFAIFLYFSYRLADKTAPIYIHLGDFVIGLLIGGLPLFLIFGFLFGDFIGLTLAIWGMQMPATYLRLYTRNAKVVTLPSSGPHEGVIIEGRAIPNSPVNMMYMPADELYKEAPSAESPADRDTLNPS